MPSKHPVATCTFRRLADDRWHWSLASPSGTQMACSPVGYMTRRGALRAFHRTQELFAVIVTEKVVED